MRWMVLRFSSSYPPPITVLTSLTWEKVAPAAKAKCDSLNAPNFNIFSAPFTELGVSTVGLGFGVWPIICYLNMGYDGCEM